MNTVDTEVTPSLHALFGESIDYAGLFPPAALALEPALDNHADYGRSHDAWMLGCFVLPMTKLPEAGRLLAGRFDAEHPFRVSALASKANSVGESLDDLRAGLCALADFQKVHGAVVSVEQLEMSLPPDVTSETALGSLLKNAADLIEETCGSEKPLRAFWEIPVSDQLPARLQRIASHNADTLRPFGAKLRTGGTEAAAIPSPARLADALVAARDAWVALKFTAGLHHPFRRYDAGVAAPMHGFVNVFAAGMLLHRHLIDPSLVRTVLEDETPGNFQFDAEGFQWRGHRVISGEIAETRAFVTSFGSCSFDEPREDLRAAHLLP